MNNKLKLIPLRECINEETYGMYQDIPSIELGSSNIFNKMNYEKFLKEVNKVLDEEFNTTKRYILVKNEKPIGEVGIRTTLNDYWVNKGSQIFYKLRLSERKKGYGNQMLFLALKEAKNLGFKKIRVNCDNNNLASKKVIMNNGGIPDIVNYETEEGISTSYIINL